jgi:hypothetical protein
MARARADTKQKLASEAVEHAHMIRVDALTLMGEHLIVRGMNAGGRPTKETTDTMSVVSGVPPLRDLGINFREFGTAQALAMIAKKHADLHEKVRSGDASISAAVTPLAGARDQSSPRPRRSRPPAAGRAGVAPRAA